MDENRRWAASRWVDTGKAKVKKPELTEERDREPDTKCSACGGPTRNRSRRTERLCLICYARKLNDYFQKMGAYASS